MDRVRRLRELGFIVCHIVSNLYLVRMYPHRGLIFPMWIPND